MRTPVAIEGGTAPMRILAASPDCNSARQRANIIVAAANAAGIAPSVTKSAIMGGASWINTLTDRDLIEPPPAFPFSLPASRR
ncbi:MAG: hypothetical protein U0R49_07550 [Fimbriimonadales bacterium]